MHNVWGLFLVVGLSAAGAATEVKCGPFSACGPQPGAACGEGRRRRWCESTQCDFWGVCHTLPGLVEEECSIPCHSTPSPHSLHPVPEPPSAPYWWGSRPGLTPSPAGEALSPVGVALLQASAAVLILGCFALYLCCVRTPPPAKESPTPPGLTPGLVPLGSSPYCLALPYTEVPNPAEV